MAITEFFAECPHKIGDEITDYESNTKHIITDIAVINYVKHRKTEFMFELDNDGKYLLLRESKMAGGMN